MIIGKCYVLLFLLIIAIESTTTDVNFNAVRSVSDSPILVKILQSVDAATSDDHLFDVTLKLLKSLCVCMHETLKVNERSKSFHGDTNSLQIEDESHESDQKVLELYTKIYNNTCFNLRHELATKLNRIHDTFLGNDKDLMSKSNCGKKMDITTENVVEISSRLLPTVQNDINSKLKQLLLKTLILTQPYHKYTIKSYNLFKKAKPQFTVDSARHSIIIIITLRTVQNINKTYEDSSIISDEELNNTLYTKSPIDIDIIDTKYRSDVKESIENMKTSIASDCNLQSIYYFLVETEKRNFTKVFKVLKRKGTIKIYIDVITFRHHSDYSRICCSDNGKTMCDNDLIKEDIANKEVTNIHNTRNNKTEGFMDTFSKIKALVKMYDEKIKHSNKSTGSDSKSIKAKSTKSVSLEDLVPVKQDNIISENKQKSKDILSEINFQGKEKDLLPQDYKYLSSMFDRTLNKSGLQIIMKENLFKKISHLQNDKPTILSTLSKNSIKVTNTTSELDQENKEPKFTKNVSLNNGTGTGNAKSNISMIVTANKSLVTDTLDITENISTRPQNSDKINTHDYYDTFTTDLLKIQDDSKEKISNVNLIAPLADLTSNNGVLKIMNYSLDEMQYSKVNVTQNNEMYPYQINIATKISTVNVTQTTTVQILSSTENQNNIFNSKIYPATTDKNEKIHTNTSQDFDSSYFLDNQTKKNAHSKNGIGVTKTEKYTANMEILSSTVKYDTDMNTSLSGYYNVSETPTQQIFKTNVYTNIDSDLKDHSNFDKIDVNTNDQFSTIQQIDKLDTMSAARQNNTDTNTTVPGKSVLPRIPTQKTFEMALNNYSDIKETSTVNEYLTRVSHKNLVNMEQLEEKQKKVVLTLKNHTNFNTMLLTTPIQQSTKMEETGIDYKTQSFVINPIRIRYHKEEQDLVSQSYTSTNLKIENTDRISASLQGKNGYTDEYKNPTENFFALDVGSINPTLQITNPVVKEFHDTFHDNVNLKETADKNQYDHNVKVSISNNSVITQQSTKKYDYILSYTPQITPSIKSILTENQTTRDTTIQQTFQNTLNDKNTNLMITDDEYYYPNLTIDEPIRTDQLTVEREIISYTLPNDTNTTPNDNQVILLAPTQPSFQNTSYKNTNLEKSNPDKNTILTKSEVIMIFGPTYALLQTTNPTRQTFKKTFSKNTHSEHVHNENDFQTKVTFESRNTKDQDEISFTMHNDTHSNTILPDMNFALGKPIQKTLQTFYTNYNSVTPSAENKNKKKRTTKNIINNSTVKNDANTYTIPEEYNFVLETPIHRDNHPISIMQHTEKEDQMNTENIVNLITPTTQTPLTISITAPNSKETAENDKRMKVDKYDLMESKNDSLKEDVPIFVAKNHSGISKWIKNKETMLTQTQSTFDKNIKNQKVLNERINLKKSDVNEIEMILNNQQNYMSEKEIPTSRVQSETEVITFPTFNNWKMRVLTQKPLQITSHLNAIKEKTVNENDHSLKITMDTIRQVKSKQLYVSGLTVHNKKNTNLPKNYEITTNQAYSSIFNTNENLKNIIDDEYYKINTNNESQVFASTNKNKMPFDTENSVSLTLSDLSQRDVLTISNNEFKRQKSHTLLSENLNNKFMAKTDTEKDSTFKGNISESNILSDTDLRNKVEVTKNIISNLNKDNLDDLSLTPENKTEKIMLDFSNTNTEDSYMLSILKDTNILFPVLTHRTKKNTDSTTNYVENGNKTRRPYFEYTTMHPGNSIENDINDTSQNIATQNNILPNITTKKLNQIYSSIISPTKQQMKRLVSSENRDILLILQSTSEHYKQLEEYDTVKLDESKELQVLELNIPTTTKISITKQDQKTSTRNNETESHLISTKFNNTDLVNILLSNMKINLSNKTFTNPERQTEISPTNKYSNEIEIPEVNGQSILYTTTLINQKSYKDITSPSEGYLLHNLIEENVTAEPNLYITKSIKNKTTQQLKPVIEMTSPSRNVLAVKNPDIFNKNKMANDSTFPIALERLEQNSLENDILNFERELTAPFSSTSHIDNMEVHTVNTNNETYLTTPIALDRIKLTLRNTTMNAMTQHSQSSNENSLFTISPTYQQLTYSTDNLDMQIHDINTKNTLPNEHTTHTKSDVFVTASGVNKPTSLKIKETRENDLDHFKFQIQLDTAKAEFKLNDTKSMIKLITNTSQKHKSLRIYTANDFPSSSKHRALKSLFENTNLTQLKTNSTKITTIKAELNKLILENATQMTLIDATQLVKPKYESQYLNKDILSEFASTSSFTFEILPHLLPEKGVIYSAEPFYDKIESPRLENREFELKFQNQYHKNYATVTSKYTKPNNNETLKYKDNNNTKSIFLTGPTEIVSIKNYLDTIEKITKPLNLQNKTAVAVEEVDTSIKTSKIESTIINEPNQFKTENFQYRTKIPTNNKISTNCHYGYKTNNLFDLKEKTIEMDLDEKTNIILPTNSNWITSSNSPSVNNGLKMKTELESFGIQADENGHIPHNFLMETQVTSPVITNNNLRFQHFNITDITITKPIVTTKLPTTTNVTNFTSESIMANLINNRTDMPQLEKNYSEYLKTAESKTTRTENVSSQNTKNAESDVFIKVIKENLLAVPISSKTLHKNKNINEDKLRFTNRKDVILNFHIVSTKQVNSPSTTLRKGVELLLENLPENNEDHLNEITIIPETIITNLNENPNDRPQLVVHNSQYLGTEVSKTTKRNGFSSKIIENIMHNTTAQDNVSINGMKSAVPISFNSLHKLKNISKDKLSVTDISLNSEYVSVEPTKCLNTTLETNVKLLLEISPENNEGHKNEIAMTLKPFITSLNQNTNKTPQLVIHDSQYLVTKVDKTTKKDFFLQNNVSIITMKSVVPIITSAKTLHKKQKISNDTLRFTNHIDISLKSENVLSEPINFPSTKWKKSAALIEKKEIMDTVIPKPMFLNESKLRNDFIIVQNTSNTALLKNNKESDEIYELKTIFYTEPAFISQSNLVSKPSKTNHDRKYQNDINLDFDNPKSTQNTLMITSAKHKSAIFRFLSSTLKPIKSMTSSYETKKKANDKNQAINKFSQHLILDTVKNLIKQGISKSNTTSVTNNYWKANEILIDLQDSKGRTDNNSVNLTVLSNEINKRTNTSNQNSLTDNQTTNNIFNKEENTFINTNADDAQSKIKENDKPVLLIGGTSTLEESTSNSSPVMFHSSIEFSNILKGKNKTFHGLGKLYKKYDTQIQDYDFTKPIKSNGNESYFVTLGLNITTKKPISRRLNKNYITNNANNLTKSNSYNFTKFNKNLHQPENQFDSKTSVITYYPTAISSITETLTKENSGVKQFVTELSTFTKSDPLQISLNKPLVEVTNKNIITTSKKISTQFYRATNDKAVSLLTPAVIVPSFNLYETTDNIVNSTNTMTRTVLKSGQSDILGNENNSKKLVIFNSTKRIEANYKHEYTLASDFHNTRKMLQPPTPTIATETKNINFLEILTSLPLVLSEKNQTTGVHDDEKTSDKQPNSLINERYISSETYANHGIVNNQLITNEIFLKNNPGSFMYNAPQEMNKESSSSEHFTYATTTLFNTVSAKEISSNSNAFAKPNVVLKRFDQKSSITDATSGDRNFTNRYTMTKTYRFNNTDIDLKLITPITKMEGSRHFIKNGTSVDYNNSYGVIKFINFTDVDTRQIKPNDLLPNNVKVLDTYPKLVTVRKDLKSLTKESKSSGNDIYIPINHKKNNNMSHSPQYVRTQLDPNKNIASITKQNLAILNPLDILKPTNKKNWPIKISSKYSKIQKFNTHDIQYVTMTTKKTKTIKYNTYKPTTEDLDSPISLEARIKLFKKGLLTSNNKTLKGSQSGIKIKNTLACTLLRNLSHHVDVSLKSFIELVKVSNCSEDIAPITLSSHPTIKDKVRRNKIITKNYKALKSTIRKNIKLLDPFAKTNLYPVKMVSPKTQRKVIRRIQLGGKTKEIMTMNTGDFFAHRKFVTQRNIINEAFKIRPEGLNMRVYKPTKAPKQVVLRPKFKQGRGRGNFRPKPLVYENKETFFNDGFQNHRRSNDLSWRDKVNFMQEVIKKKELAASKYNVLARPYAMEHSMKPKFLRDRVDSIRNYLINTEFVKTTTQRDYFLDSPLKDSGDDREDDDDDAIPQPLLLPLKSNFWIPEEELTTTKKPRRTRPRKTIFFLSPTVPYNRYF